MEMPRRILITGASGVVGQRLLEHQNAWANQDILLPVAFTNPNYPKLDITDINQIQQVFHKHQPDVVIHLAALRNASKIEEERDDIGGSAYQTNVVGTNNLARACLAAHAKLIYISSGFVFSGKEHNQGPYDELTRPEPSNDLLSWYGVTKRLGEEVVLANPNTAVVRIDNVSDPGNPGDDYIGKILNLYEADKSYPMFEDQWVTIAKMSKLAEVIGQIIDRSANGVFHVASSDRFTPHQLANYAILLAYGVADAIPAGSITNYLKDHPNRYPQYGGLLTPRTQQILGVQFDSWSEIVRDFIEERELIKK